VASINCHPQSICYRRTASSVAGQGAVLESMVVPRGGLWSRRIAANIAKLPGLLAAARTWNSSQRRNH
jgi:hypothetical protein